MSKIRFLENTIQKYSWGSITAIPDLLGIPATGEPMAELWMGAHPKAPSMVIEHGDRVSLDELIAQNPVEILGYEASKQFKKKLPFLFKILAAEKPLSIQAHPNKQQAQEGFARENKLKIPIDSPQRNYRDDNHKPEIICALTDFWALNGFRKIVDSIEFLNTLAPENLKIELDILKAEPVPEGFRHFYHTLMNHDQSKKSAIINEAIIRAGSMRQSDPLFEWVVKLHDEYPDDIGILAPAYLNLVKLNPGEALFLEAGVLHSYLHGLGVELMVNSDNVLRGGLTPKHIDLNELFRIVKFEEQDIEIIKPEELLPFEFNYIAPVDEFELGFVKVTDDILGYGAHNRCIEILICVDGEAEIFDTNDDTTVISKGQVIMIPASIETYDIEGNASFYRATIMM